MANLTCNFPLKMCPLIELYGHVENGDIFMRDCCDREIITWRA